tara:strand:+ start:53 stop:1162 length:1110 start_codon:yes stop_codon:yes gene_type:complete
VGTGGAEFSTLTFYSWLQKKPNIEIKLVCLKKLEIQFNHLDFGLDNLEYIKETSFFSRLKQFNNIVDAFQPDIVHSVLFEANLIARVSKVFQGKFKHLESLVNQTYSPHRLNDPNVNSLKLESYRILDMITQRFGVDHFHSNGLTVSKHYQEKLYINENRITVIPRGRNANKYLEDNRHDSPFYKNINPENKILLINVARHEFQKAQDVLLDALKLLPKLRDQFLLLLVGRKGEATAMIEDKIKEFNLGKQVKVMGYRDDVVKLLALSDVFVFPSRFEGLPGALIEAEAAKLPIVCSNIPNNMEVVQENENALIFPVDNFQVLAQHLEKLILNANLRKSMGEQSLRIFKEKFTIENVHEKMHALLKTLI